VYPSSVYPSSVSRAESRSFESSHGSSFRSVVSLRTIVAEWRGLLLFAFHFFFVIRTDRGTDGLTFKLIDRHNHLFLSVRDQGIDQTWIDAGEQEAKECFVQLASPIEFFQLLGIKLEIRQPIGSLLVAVDRIGEPLLSPESAHQNLAAEIGDHRLNAAGNPTWVASVVVAIKEKQ